MAIVDKSLHFGNQNQFFVQAETIGDYMYVGYQNRKGLILLAKYKVDGTEGRYCVKTGNFEEVWENKETYIYTYPALLEDPVVKP